MARWDKDALSLLFFQPLINPCDPEPGGGSGTGASPENSAERLTRVPAPPQEWPGELRWDTAVSRHSSPFLNW